MVRSSQKRAHRRALDRHGATVDLYNYTEDTTERVQTWTETAGSPHSITARVVPRNTPTHTPSERESGDVAFDVRVLIADDASGVSGIRDGGGKGASVIDPDQDGVAQDGTDYRVLLKHDEGNGLLRLDCVRID